MSLKENINKIHYDLTTRFGEVSITEKSSLKFGNYFELSVLENNKEVKLILKKNDVENYNFNWSYYSNPLKEDSYLVERCSNVDSITLHIQDIFEKNRFDSEYNG